LTLDTVIHKPKAFQFLEVGGAPNGDSPLWKESADPEKLTGAKLKGWRRAMAVADGILKGKITDPTGGATFFIASTTYQRGKPLTTEGFFRRSLKSGRLVDSAYISDSKRKTQNHCFVEMPASRPPTRKARSKQR
jgi:hypothetical protein